MGPGLENSCFSPQLEVIWAGMLELQSWMKLKFSVELNNYFRCGIFR